MKVKMQRADFIRRILVPPNENKMSHAAVDGVGCKLRVELGKR